MLWFNFILEINFICPCSWVWWGMIMSLKQKQIKFKPRTKLNCSKYNWIMVSVNNSTNYSSNVNEKNYRGWLFGNYLHQPVVYFSLKNVRKLCKLESLLVIRFEQDRILIIIVVELGCAYVVRTLKWILNQNDFMLVSFLISLCRLLIILSIDQKIWKTFKLGGNHLKWNWF